MRKPPTTLPRGITVRRLTRGRWVLELSFVDQHGKRQYERVGSNLRDAQQLLRQRRQEVAAGTYAPPSSGGGFTLDDYASEWFEAREAAGRVRSVKDERARYWRHISPHLGDMRLDAIKPRDVKAWVDKLDAGHLSAKSVKNVHGVLHAMLEHAAFEERVIRNPASLPKGMLPRAPKHPGQRWTRAEVEQLLTDERIRWDRRVLYALEALTGMRCGEASGRRWRDLDRNAKPLYRLRCDSQYDDQPLKTSRGEDIRARDIPVHPELARILAEWRLTGWPAFYGRTPGPNDWIVPDLTTGRARTENQMGKAMDRDRDRLELPRLMGPGTRGRRHHAFRRAFISLVRSDGGRPDVLERITHNAAGTILDSYTSFEWAAMCECVQCLRVDLGGAQVLMFKGGGE